MSATRTNSPIRAAFDRKRAVWAALFLYAIMLAYPSISFSQNETATQLKPATWPTRAQIVRVVTMRDQNTWIVVAGTTMLGLAAGIIGTFAYLRKRALMGDALSHATLPGIAIVFLLVGAKNAPQLLLGGAATGVLGILCVLGIRASTRTKEDAAIGIVLSVFFAAGMALFSVVQTQPTGEQAGLHSYIYGQAAAMSKADMQRIAFVAGLVVLCVAVLYKEFHVVCFDRAFAASQGVSVTMVDLLMMMLVVFTTVIGLYAVGLIMIVALLIIPPAAARFWTDSLTLMTVLAGVFGAISGVLGAMVSALFKDMPAGALIVISAGAVFVVSMLAAPKRGVIAQALRHTNLSRTVARQNLLRAFAEIEEREGEGATVSYQALRGERGWSQHALNKAIAKARRALLVTGDEQGGFRLSTPGRKAAREVLRNHRLWELFLIRYADIAPSHVDRDADEIEHFLGPEVVAELERALEERRRIPASPHTTVTEAGA